MRIARCTSPQVVYHVTSRFVEGNWRLQDELERAHYLQLFQNALEKTDWLSLGYALMSSHIHHALVAGDVHVGALFKRVHSPFGNWINERQERIGPVFASRATMWAIRPEHVPRVLAYIHNNPVRAHVVRRADDSDWTSHRAYTGQVEAPTWLAVDQGLSRCGMTPEQFDGFVNGPASEDQRVDLAAIQRVARRRGAIQIATPTLSPTAVPLLARRFARIRPDPRNILDAVARLVGMRVERFSSRSTDRTATLARKIAVHAGCAVGLTASDMGTALGVSRQAASRIASAAAGDITEAITTVIRAQLTDVTTSPANVAEVHGFKSSRS